MSAVHVCFPKGFYTTYMEAITPAYLIVANTPHTQQASCRLFSPISPPKIGLPPPPPPHPNRANPIPPRTSTSSSLVSPSAPIPTQHTKTPHLNPRPTHQRPTRHTSPLARTLQLLPSPNLVFEPRRWFTSTWRYSIEYEANTFPIRRLRPRHPIPLHD